MKNNLLFGAVVLVLLFLHTRGFATADEGWILQASKRLADGEIIYKDFQFIYHPAVLYINALAYKLLGVSVLTSRLVAFGNSLLAAWLFFLIARKISVPYLQLVMGLCIFIFWGAGHINFSWPVMFCITSALASVYFWIKWFETKQLKNIFWVGFCAAITVLFKQNFGLAILGANGVFMLVLLGKDMLKIIFQFSCGFTTVIAAQLIYFLITGSLSWYLSDMQYLLIQQIFLKGVLNSAFPWEYPAPLLHQLVKVGMYTAPAFISLAAVIFSWKNNAKPILYASLLSISYYGLSIRPTTDYIHLAPLIAMSGLPLMYLASLFKKWWWRIAVHGSLSLLVLIGVYSAIFKNYYRWDTPLVAQSSFAMHPGVLISIDDASQKNLMGITEFFKRQPDQEYLFVYSFSPQFNVIVDKKNPTRYDYLHTGVLSEKIEEEVISDVSSSDVKYILSDVPVEKERDSIAQFIRAEYLPVVAFDKYTIWQKK